MRRAMLLSAFALGCAAFGCATTQSTYDRPVPTEAKTRPAPMGVVEAGSDVYGTLDDTLSTRTCKAGDAFVLHVVQPVSTNDGRVVIQPGAIVHGHVVEVNGAPNPSLRVAFDTIETSAGPQRFEATLLDAGKFAIVGVAPRNANYDSTLTPPLGPYSSVGGGPPPGELQGADEPPTYHLVIPRGAELHLMLLSHFVPHEGARGP